MSANDYFNAHPGNPHLNQPTASTSYSNPGYSQSPYTSQSPYLTPSQSHDRVGDSPGSRYHDHSPYGASTPFQEQIPLKQTSKIQTNSDSWQQSNPHFLSSPAVQSTPIESERPRRKRKSKKKGFFAGPIPWVVYTFTLVQMVVFIVEIVRNATLTKSPIMIKPQFNPMIGPSVYVLINMGARFVPCMRTTAGVTDTSLWPCPNTTTSDPNSPTNQCTLGDLCGFGGINPDNPNQWFRFIVPMFLHAGLIHIGFNMLLQLTMGREMERTIGSIRFFLVYVSSGIFGFVLGGNLAPPAIASTGASGSLFGILAIVLLDLLYSWQERVSPVKELMWILVDIVISFVLGLLPGLDNFSHIGGFLMGLVCGICILHSPKTLRQRIGSMEPYRNLSSQNDMRTTMSGGLAPSPSPTNPTKSDTATMLKTAGPNTPSATVAFAKRPIGFFKGRKPLWWAWWLIRAGALIGVAIAFIVLITNFYNYRTQCKWCKYLSCMPINGWCDLGNLQINNNGTNTTKRGLDLDSDLGLGLDTGLFMVGAQY